MRMDRKTLLTLIALLFALSACGQKGDLVRPEPQPETATNQ